MSPQTLLTACRPTWACVTEVRRSERVNSSAVKQCIDQFAGNYFDSVLALDRNGRGEMSASGLPQHLDSVLRLRAGELTTAPPRADHDWTDRRSADRQSCRRQRELLGAGLKSGYYWALDRHGEVLEHSRRAGLGGLQWGSAVDSTRIYTANANSGEVRWELFENGKGTGLFTRRGFWSALDPATGVILWQTVDPSGNRLEGPVSVAN
jgi:polyvinyl alcohol dehydrogenase (cytochrome)